MAAFCPPTVSEKDCWECGRLVIGVLDDGADPVASAGVSGPSPVTYSTCADPRVPLAPGTSAPLASVKIPGAAAEMASEEFEILPLLLTVTLTFDPAAASYGTCTL